MPGIPGLSQHLLPRFRGSHSWDVLLILSGSSYVLLWKVGYYRDTCGWKINVPCSAATTFQWHFAWCQYGMEKMQEALLFFADFPLTFTMSTLPSWRTWMNRTSIAAHASRNICIFCTKWLRQFGVSQFPFCCLGVTTIVGGHHVRFRTASTHKLSLWRGKWSSFWANFFRQIKKCGTILQKFGKEGRMLDFPHN